VPLTCWWPKALEPPVIDVAASDAQAAVGVRWYTPAGKDTPAEPPRRAQGCHQAVPPTALAGDR